MRKATAVIGAGYGDEGKGLVTSTLAHTHDIVVRHSGGSQAAHTVEYNGLRHVFGHFGSGTLQGLPTYLSKFFIINPMTFRKEWNELESKGVTPVVYIDPMASVTTPFDMFINQRLERNRGNKKHGSCGLGINETITRGEHYAKITTRDLQSYKLTHSLLVMLKNYFKNRAQYYSMDIPEFKNERFVDNVIKNFVEDAQFMLDRVTIRSDSILHHFDNVLFEGAQGLMLDEYYGEFPHVTRSRTGVNNVHAIMCSVDCAVPLKAYYVTRHYLTRHGAGPLANGRDLPSWVKDKTNIPNEWQGSLRYAPLDLDQLDKFVKIDSRKTGIRTENNMVVTCLDQGKVIPLASGYKYLFVHDNLGQWDNDENLIKTIEKKIGWPVYTTKSPITQKELGNG